MDLEGTKAELQDFISSLDEYLELIEDTKYFLVRLIEHLERLQNLEAERALDALKTELRETRLTLNGLKETLLLYPNPDPQMIAKIDEATAEVDSNLVRVKKGIKLKKALPVIAIGGLLGYALIRKKLR